MTLLKVLLRQDAWTPLQNNIAACCLTVAYCKVCLEGIAWLRSLRVLAGMTNMMMMTTTTTTANFYYSKQLVYMLLSTCILFWPLFDRSDWSWRLNAVLPAAMLCRFVYKVRCTTRHTRARARCISAVWIVLLQVVFLTHAIVHPHSKIDSHFAFVSFSRERF